MTGYGTDTDTIKENLDDLEEEEEDEEEEDSDYGSYNRKHNNDDDESGIYFAKFVDIVTASREGSAPPPPRPPPPTDYNNFYSLPRPSHSDAGLKRSQSLQHFKQPQMILPPWMVNADIVPDFPTPFDTFVSNSHLNRS
jgi:hypothetical protein